MVYISVMIYLLISSSAWKLDHCNNYTAYLYYTISFKVYMSSIKNYYNRKMLNIICTCTVQPCLIKWGKNPQSRPKYAFSQYVVQNSKYSSAWFSMKYKGCKTVLNSAGSKNKTDESRNFGNASMKCGHRTFQMPSPECWQKSKKSHPSKSQLAICNENLG